MIIFASCFMIGKAQEWGIFPKCDVGHNYHPSRPLISRMCLLGFYLTLELMFENQTQLPTLALFFLGASFFFLLSFLTFSLRFFAYSLFLRIFSLYPFLFSLCPNLLIYYYWMEGYNLVGTCLTSYIFSLLCCLTFFCSTNMIFKPNLLFPRGWAWNHTLKLLWNLSPIALTIVVDHVSLNLVLSSFSILLWVIHLAWVTIPSTLLDFFLPFPLLSNP